VKIGIFCFQIQSVICHYQLLHDNRTKVIQRMAQQAVTHLVKNH